MSLDIFNANNLVLGNTFDLISLIPDKSVDLILIDPPYDFNESQKTFLHQHFLRICKGDILVFSPPENQWIFDGVRYLFWNKATSTKNYSRNYGRFVEMIFFYKRGAVWNSHLNWSNYVGVYDDKVIGESDCHFEKPYSLVERFIRIHTNPGDTVCDLFFGSGVVLLAAKNLQRKYLGIEMNRACYEYAKSKLE